MQIYSSNLIVIPLLRASNTTVESSWRFICTSNLNLHKVSFVEIALRTSGRSSIDVLPGIFTSQNIVRLLSLNFSVRSICRLQGVKIWATGAAKSHSIHIFFKKQQVAAHRTEMHFLRWVHSPLKRKIETTKISTVQCLDNRMSKSIDKWNVGKLLFQRSSGLWKWSPRCLVAMIVG